MSQIVSFSLKEELKKNSELKESNIQSLREWCKKQPHLPKISDSSLALFLHSNYYLMEPTKTTIDNYYTIRTLVPEFFADRDPLGNREARQAFNFMTTLALKTTTKEGYHILFMSITEPDATNFSIAAFSKFAFMVLDLWINRSGCIPGHVVILDVKNVGMGHAARSNPLALKKLLLYIQEGMPVRLKGLHYFNVTPGMQAVLKIMKPFLKKELMSILHMHPSTKTLKDFLPIEALPNELGGEAGPLTELHEAVIQDLEANREWFLNQELQGRVDETKRLGKAKTASEMFGVEGSFKKLDLD